MAGQGQRGDYGRVTQVGQAAAQRGARAKGAQRPALPTVRPRYAGSPGAKCQERRSQRSECNVVGLSSGPAQRSTAHCSAQLSTLTGLDLALSCSFLRREATPTHPTVRRSESRTSTQYRHSLPTPALPGNEIRAAIGASIPPPACHSRLPDSSIVVHTPLTSPPVHAYYSYWNKHSCVALCNVLHSQRSLRPNGNAACHASHSGAKRSAAETFFEKSNFRHARALANPACLKLCLSLPVVPVRVLNLSRYDNAQQMRVIGRHRAIRVHKAHQCPELVIPIARHRTTRFHRSSNHAWRLTWPSLSHALSLDAFALL